MRGIEDVLVGKMGFKRTDVEWRTAWDMTLPKGERDEKAKAPPVQ